MVSAIRSDAGQILTDDIHHTTNNHILKMVVLIQNVTIFIFLRLLLKGL